MNSIKRLYVSIKSQIDHVADEFENHEALAGVAIKDLHDIAGKTRVHLHRVKKINQHYQTQINELQAQETLWSARAVKAKQQDEKKAMQCVKRLLQTKKQITLIEQQYDASMEQENKITVDLSAVQEQMLVLNNKKEMLAARQNRNHLQGQLQDNQTSSLVAVQQVFDRWEGQVVVDEYAMPITEKDALQDDFEKEEEALALKMMLDELCESEQSSDNN